MLSDLRVKLVTFSRDYKTWYNHLRVNCCKCLFVLRNPKPCCLWLQIHFKAKRTNRGRLMKLQDTSTYQVYILSATFVPLCSEFSNNFHWREKHRWSFGWSLKVRIFVATKCDLRKHRNWTFNNERVPFCNFVCIFLSILSVSSGIFHPLKLINKRASISCLSFFITPYYTNFPIHNVNLVYHKQTSFSTMKLSFLLLNCLLFHRRNQRNGKDSKKIEIDNTNWYLLVVEVSISMLPQIIFVSNKKFYL